MKKSDIISVVFVALIGTFVANFLVNLLMGNPDEASRTYKDIAVVDSTLETPDSELFNADAINPTVEVYVGNCEDIDHDGELSRAELVACGRTDDSGNMDNLDDFDGLNNSSDDENDDGMSGDDIGNNAGDDEDDSNDDGENDNNDDDGERDDEEEK